MFILRVIAHYAIMSFSSWPGLDLILSLCIFLALG